MIVCVITTIDNPYDPIDQFDQWLQYDLDKHYGTCSYLDRVARTSEMLTEEENAKEIERAIDEMIKYDFQGLYKKVKREVKDKNE